MKRFDLVILALCVTWILLSIRFSREAWFDKIEIVLTRVPAFLLGCLIGKLAYQNKKLPLSIAVLSFIAMFPMFHLYLSGLPKVYYRYLGFAIAVALVIALSCFFGTRKCGPIRKALMGIGSYSMEVYMLYTAVGIKCANVFYENSASGIGYYIPVFC